MSEEKCCCNCLHCARWSTSKGIECHCDLTDRYLGYLEVMDTDNDCCRWEKETKWDLEKEHDKQIRADAISQLVLKLEVNMPSELDERERYGYTVALTSVLEQLKDSK